ncbi:hypothetical protein HG531_003494 [Fusarium graminearum]|nr:hypothetical protein HG531_003494 [Fusarium graminearum]
MGLLEDRLLPGPPSGIVFHLLGGMLTVLLLYILLEASNFLAGSLKLFLQLGNAVNVGLSIPHSGLEGLNLKNSSAEMLITLGDRATGLTVFLLNTTEFLFGVNGDGLESLELMRPQSPWSSSNVKFLNLVQVGGERLDLNICEGLISAFISVEQIVEAKTDLSRQISKFLSRFTAFVECLVSVRQQRQRSCSQVLKSSYSLGSDDLGTSSVCDNCLRLLGKVLSKLLVIALCRNHALDKTSKGVEGNGCRVKVALHDVGLHVDIIRIVGQAV